MRFRGPDEHPANGVKENNKKVHKKNSAIKRKIEELSWEAIEDN